ncbi:hypothetical protein [Laspinema olomoucense]|uniref:Uncharacterized protein n=1 Tax=Laspinema olomoucense D3b TaxID=2953688 RepID=A0ABT2N4R2_9CYAN|nr:hypothetical protein [Laspinema sp. D3b]MCT7977681.1 hypothetical protein [Laspinema sp. D3b]
MNVIKVDNFAFRIPEVPLRYRGNCHKEWGVFLCSNSQLKGMSHLEAKESGLTRGKVIELALCHVTDKILTFEPHYTSEEFKEIWGFPVKGEVKAELVENCSQLITFLLHRQSKDKIARIFEEFSQQAFNSWVSSGMEKPIEEYATEEIKRLFFGKIFIFEMVQAVGDWGPYFYIETTYREPENDFEKAALKAASEIYDAQCQGMGFCSDPILEANHAANVNLLSASGEIAELPPVNDKKLKAGKAK